VYSGGEAELSELAAAYASGLANNHPCIDGNKRLAFLSIGLFSRLNGYRLIAGKVEAVEVMVALAAGKLSEEELSRWIKGHTERPHRRGLRT
jgi:death-on-curing protein